MKTKHTPGPWTAYQLDNSRRQILDHGSRGPRTVCKVNDATDARLIAAAPEMLEALELIKDRLESYDVVQRFETTHDLMQALLAAGDAIRKAKGDL